MNPPTHQATARNRYCADRVQLSLHIASGQVIHASWEGHACAVCSASAQSLCAAWTGLPTADLEALEAELERSLSGTNEGRFASLPPLAHLPSRHACARLPFEAARAALHPRPSPETRTAASHGQPPADDAWGAATAFRARGLDVVLATLVEVVGSSPCPVGSHMVVADNGEFWGAVSGGCVEAAVVHAGVALLEGRRGPGVETFQIANSQAGEIGLPCGGQVHIHLAAAPGDAQLRRYRARGRGLARVVDLSTGAERLERSERLRPGRVGDRFIEPLTAAPKLVLVGGTRIAQVLDRLARAVGFEVCVVEPRAGFAGPYRFEGEVIDNLPAEALPGRIDADTAVVMLTHDARIDDPGLQIALRSDAFYVGALGSRKTQRARLERLREAGLPEAALERLRGPAGLAIGAVGAEEIALSILAEVVSTRRAAEPRDVGIVVLAAGTSERAGPSNKLLQDIDGRPMIRRVVERAIQAHAGPCAVVLGHEREAVRAILDDLPVQFVEHPHFARGMGSSIAAGIEALSAHDVSAALVMLGDMPFVAESSIQAILSAHTPATRHLVIAPLAGDGPDRRRGNPVLWPARYFADLMRLDGDEGGRSILARAPGAVLEIALEDPGVLRDIDTVLTPIDP